MPIAYLVNQYPKVSHTFIRREIHALEQLGSDIRRFSIRPSPDRLDDADDLAEVPKTRVLLQTPPARVGATLARTAARDPRRFAQAASLAMSLGGRSDRGRMVHGAYLAEACILLDALRSEGVTHLHAHFGTNSATVALLCRALGGPPFSFTVHGPEEFDKARLIGLSEKIHRAKFVAAVSSFGRAQLMRFCALEDVSKLHVVRCGVDASYLASEPTPIPRAPRLVSVGRLSEQKGHSVLIDAAAELARAGREFELVLVGDGELRAPIEERIADFGLAGRVRITGWLDGAGVREELRKARALVLPSFAEGLPVVIMEALAMGRPVISTYVAGIPELVASGACGWLVPAGSVAELADAMISALDGSEASLEEMGRVGRARVAAQHNSIENARLLWTLMQTGGG
jgi:colanic acid/amylovoran biosynthesis glycosyltransferase